MSQRQQEKSFSVSKDKFIIKKKKKIALPSHPPAPSNVNDIKSNDYKIHHPTRKKKKKKKEDNDGALKHCVGTRRQSPEEIARSGRQFAAKPGVAEPVNSGESRDHLERCYV